MLQAYYGGETVELVCPPAVTDRAVEVLSGSALKLGATYMMWDEQVTEASSVDKEGTKLKPQKATAESASTLQKEQSQAVGERKPVEENGLSAGSGNPKGAKPATEKRVPNGVANGCSGYLMEISPVKLKCL